MSAVVFGPDLAMRRFRSQTRIGLVLGAGGVLGAAWMTGALAGLQDRLPCAAADVDLVVGTSAGSVLAAALRCRASLEEMVAWQCGDGSGILSESAVLAAKDGPLPPIPHLRPGSLPLARAALLRPLKVPPWVGASGWLPHGRGQHAALRSLVGALHWRHQQPFRGGAPSHWVDGHTWVAAMDYDSGGMCSSAARTRRAHRFPTRWSPPARSRAGISRRSSAAAATWTAASGPPPHSAP